MAHYSSDMQSPVGIKKIPHIFIYLQVGEVPFLVDVRGFGGQFHQHGNHAGIQQPFDHVV